MRRVSPAPNPRTRARPTRRRWHRIATWMVAGVFFAVALGGPAWLWRSGLLALYAGQAEDAAIGASAELGLTVREVLLAGRKNADRKDLLAATGIVTGAPILAVEPERIQARLERNAWIKRALITRRLPDTILIEIEERRPFALWQRDGKLRLIDMDGTVITTHGLHRFAHLPLIVGSAQPIKAKPVLATLAREPDLNTRVRALINVGERRWNVRFDNGIDVRLPEAELASAWQELAQLDRRHALLARGITAIDLRIPGRVVVTRDRAQERLRDAEPIERPSR